MHKTINEKQLLALFQVNRRTWDEWSDWKEGYWTKWASEYEQSLRYAIGFVQQEVSKLQFDTF